MNFRPGQPVRGTERDMPGITEAWFVCMDRPESTIPRGIGCVILRRFVLTRGTDRYPPGTVVGELNAIVTPYLEPVPGREEPEREALELLRLEVLRVHALLVEKLGPRPPNAWEHIPDEWYGRLDLAVPAAYQELQRMTGAMWWGMPEGTTSAPWTR